MNEGDSKGNEMSSVSSVNPVTGRNQAFDDWYGEIESFAIRGERLQTSVAELRAAFEAGQRAETKGSVLPESSAVTGLIERLRDYDNCHDGDVDKAADVLEFLQKVVDEIPALIELVASDCGKDYIDRPSMYRRGDKWRYHKVRAGNEWNDANTPLAAARSLGK